jgi:type II secretory pathway pseudopilin PulG
VKIFDPSRPRQKHTPQRGYVLIGILFLVTLMVIGLVAVVPAIRTQIKRDREDELIRRGRQYQRAIQLYYRRFGRYPASIEQLENTNNIRFLRRKYVDPVTGKEEWKLIRFGQQRIRSRPAYLGSGTAPASALGSGTTPASAIGGSTAPTGATGGAGSSPQPPQPQAGVSNAAEISRPLSGSSTIGGGPVVGVASTSEKDALKELDGKNKYNEWEFVYDPTLDPNVRQNPNPAGGQRDSRGQRPGPAPASPQPAPQPQDRR